MIALLASFLGGVLVGYVFEREREYRTWGRYAIEVWTRPPIANLTPPTVAELRGPMVGYLAACGWCKAEGYACPVHAELPREDA